VNYCVIKWLGFLYWVFVLGGEVEDDVDVVEKTVVVYQGGVGGLTVVGEEDGEGFL
jgi:hypothetical protein